MAHVEKRARRKRQTAWLFTAAASALLLGAAGEAAAQTTDSAEVTVDDVVVTGVRASVAKSIEIKRQAVQIVESVVAEDIGKLPDNNVVEALQRVPGIQIQNRSGAEASGVFIRGMPDITTTWNGRNVFTTTGRQIALQDIPSNLVSRIDVYKTRSAEQIETGIAGQIDVATRRPFDFRGPALSTSLRLIYNEERDTYNPNVSALVSNRWETDFGDIGALLNVSFARTLYREQTAHVGALMPYMTENPSPGWNPLQRIDSGWQRGMERGLPMEPGSVLTFGGADHLYYLASDAVINHDQTGDRRRPSANIALQWAPNDTSVYTFEAFYHGYRNNIFNRMLFISADGWGSGGAGPNTAADFTLRPGTNIMQTRRVRNTGGFNSADATQQRTDGFVYALNAKWDIGDRLQLVGDVAYQTSEFETDFFAIRTERAGTNIDFNFNVGNGLPSIVFETPEILTDPAAWRIGDLFDNGDRHKGDAITASLDGDFDLEDLNWPVKRISFGYRYDDRGASQRHREQQSSGWLNHPLSDYEWLVDINTGYYGGRADIPHSWVNLNGAAAQARADTVRQLYRDNGFGHLNLEADFPYREDFSVDELTVAAYLQADLEGTLFGRRLQGQVGLRWVNVDTDMVFTDRAPPHSRTEASARVNDVLPSVTLRYHLTDDLRLRFNYGETLRRPAFADLNPNLRLVEDLSNIGQGTGTGGNPNLEPTHATNYDLALEWFFARDSGVFLTVFKRDIEGLVVPLNTVRIIPGTGLNTDRFIVNQPVNASNGRLEGAELGFVYFPEELPGLLDGFGVQGSVTVLDSSQNIPVADANGNIVGQDQSSFFGVSDLSYNLTLAYDRGPLDMRLSYVWRENYLNGNEARNFANPIGIWRVPEKSLDFQLTYDINSRTAVTLDAVNLTDELSQEYYAFADVGSHATTNTISRILGRSVAVGLRYSFR